MNSRQLAEKIWREAVRPAYAYAYEQDAGPEIEDQEAGLQALEGILEKFAGVKPDAELKRIRAENEKNGVELS